VSIDCMGNNKKQQCCRAVLWQHHALTP
jgi:hypothetical protein